MSYEKHTWVDGETIITAAIMRAIEDELESIRCEMALSSYPVGSIYMSVNNTDPAVTLGGGEWIIWGKGRVPVGVDTDDTDFNIPEKTGGHKALQAHTHSTPNHTHTANISENGAHTHSLTKATTTKTGGSATRGSGSGSGLNTSSAGSHKHTVTIASGGGSVTGSTGAGNAGNMPPFITCYMFKRVG